MTSQVIWLAELGLPCNMAESEGKAWGLVWGTEIVGLMFYQFLLILMNIWFKLSSLLQTAVLCYDIYSFLKDFWKDRSYID